jgi:preprotein translocase subunit SecE
VSTQRRTATKKGTAATATPTSPKSAATKGANAQAASGGSGKVPPAKGAQSASSGSGKSKAKASEAKPHPVKRRVESLERWYRETRAEMSKITWPDQDTTRNLTIVVIGVSIVLGLFLGGIDFILVRILEAI